MPRRLLIVADHPIFAEALTLSIRAAKPDVHIVLASSIAQAEDALSNEDGFDLVLLDLCLPDAHGFEGLIVLRNAFRKIPIVVMSASADQNVVHKAQLCGACGFIPKSATKEALLRALTKVLSGNHAFPNEHGRRDPTSNLESLTNRLRTLTPQQLRVLQFLCRGFLNKQIAHELDVNESTVKAHISEILRKLAVGSRTQAVLEMWKLDCAAVRPLYKQNEVSSGDPARGAVTRGPTLGRMWVRPSS